MPNNFWKFLCAVFLFLLSGCTERIAQQPKQKKHPWHAGSERPYVIRGVKYYPQMYYEYNAKGYASWYGKESLGPTATGRQFDPEKMTAAHRTLPLPCIVEVENLQNHRRVRLLVNDRGPFAQTDKRIIDLSERAARQLGIRRRGYGRVRVRCLPKESKIAAMRYGRIPYETEPPWKRMRRRIEQAKFSKDRQ